MAKIIKFPIDDSSKRGFKKARRKRKKNLEDFGQLNIFNQPKQARVIGLQQEGELFENGITLQESDPHKAATFYQKSIEKGEHLADSYCNLGIIHYQNGELNKAIDCFTKSLEKEHRHFESHYNLANLYFEVGDYKLAKIHYQFSEDIEPGDSNVRYNLALVLANLNQYLDAIAQLENYLELADHHNDPDVLKLISMLRESTKQG